MEFDGNHAPNQRQTKDDSAGGGMSKGNVPSGISPAIMDEIVAAVVAKVEAVLDDRHQTTEGEMVRKVTELVVAELRESNDAALRSWEERLQGAFSEIEPLKKICDSFSGQLQTVSKFTTRLAKAPGLQQSLTVTSTQPEDGIDIGSVMGSISELRKIVNGLADQLKTLSNAVAAIKPQEAEGR